jgi:hypothetical protein
MFDILSVNIGFICMFLFVSKSLMRSFLPTKDNKLHHKTNNYTNYRYMKKIYYYSHALEIFEGLLRQNIFDWNFKVTVKDVHPQRQISFCVFTIIFHKSTNLQFSANIYI